MKLSLEQLQHFLLQEHSLEIIPQERLQKMLQDARDLAFLAELPPAHLGEILAMLPHSKAQLRQDLLVLSYLACKRYGFFVEFGATNGLDWSNTHLLEKHYEWKGILAEPATVWHNDLQNNRECIIDTRCVWKESNQQLRFNETETAYLSTIASFSGKDGHKHLRRGGKRYEVESISLLELLQSHNAPTHIDYLSIDTEGSELEILSAFDFGQYSFSLITCEHNHTEDREKINSLLQQYEYTRIHEDISQFDDWYIHKSLLQ